MHTLDLPSVFTLNLLTSQTGVAFSATPVCCGLFYWIVQVVTVLENYFSSSVELSRVLLSRSGVQTGIPVSFSICFLAFPAMVLPCLATSALSLRPCGFFFLESSVVGASASILRMSFILLILSRRFSLCKPFKSLYCRVVMPDHASEIISVKEAYPKPLMPLRSHSSVKSLRISIDFIRWLIHASE